MTAYPADNSSPASTQFSAPPLPQQVGQRITWHGLNGAASSLAIAEAARSHPGLVLVLADDSEDAERLLREFEFFAPEIDILHFPDWETLAYDAFSPHQDIISQRLATLTRLPHQARSILVVPISTIVQRLPPRSYLDGRSFRLQVGQQFDLHQERRKLESAGYRTVDTVSEHGQFAVRGALMDIYPMGQKLPVRVDLFDDEIETLRTFDPDSQRTIENIESLDLLPGKEYPFDEAAISRFRDAWHNTFNVDVRRCSVYQDVSTGITPSGVEYYLPFFFDEPLANLFAYLPDNVLVVHDDGLVAAVDHYHADVLERYESLRHDVERPVIEPSVLFLRVEELHGAIGYHPRVVIARNHLETDAQQFASEPVPEVTANARAHEPAQLLLKYLKAVKRPVLFTAETLGRHEMLQEFLQRSGIRTVEVDSFAGFLNARPPYATTIAPIERSLSIAEGVVIAEAQIFGRRQHEPRTPGSAHVTNLDPEQIVRNLTELHVGAPVVHVEHGIGRYLGLSTLDIDGHTNEFLTLGYAGEAKLYVPVTSLNLISRYAGSDETLAPLHKLGSDQWEKAKRKAAEKVVDVAAELLNIYARRAAHTSAALPIPQDEYQRFADQFPFEVTTDQQAAIDDVLADLSRIQATDRLICGDVGFGKTEVAMRAAFVAVQAGKQVAVLVPTTLLAQQHLETFRDRFAQWPVQVEGISRMRSDGEIKTIGERTKAGKVDILIGTHRLLSADIGFKDLALVIIDEEHRFGVRQKERLRSLRAEVDVLTLTATPIPRTLNMAISGIRDLSIIATAPAKRLSIKTFVQQKRNHIIKEAITRELMRGGQVFYLHNEVRTIETVASELAKMVPEARIGIGHGQMAKSKLESVMGDFYHRQLNVLVCTTIIETGIDIPNANTIVIERADKFGLAQLHQLRGRVGRSHRQAYAYLLTPHPKAITPDAVKRLEAIEAAGELGVGFTLATHDLEIRGAGELLGDDQSGQIQSIGFSLYMEMLDRAVNAIRSGKTPNLDAPLEPVSQEVNLHVPVLIPEDYLPDVHSRLILYKRVASADTNAALDALQVEIIDRFGLLPEPLKNLFRVTALKLVTQELGITRCDLGESRGRLEFSQHTTVDPMSIVILVQQYPGTYKLDGATLLRITRSLPTFDDRLAFAYELLDTLRPAQIEAA